MEALLLRSSGAVQAAAGAQDLPVVLMRSAGMAVEMGGACIAAGFFARPDARA